MIQHIIRSFSILISVAHKHHKRSLWFSSRNCSMLDATRAMMSRASFC